MKQEKLSNLFDYLPKSKIKAGDGQQEGKYPFYTSSENQSKYLDEFQHEPGCLVFGTGGKASIHLTLHKFATSTDCITLKPKSSIGIDASYVYHYLKGNMQILENGFKGAGLKHISKGYLSEIKIPYPEKIVDQIRIANLLSKVELLIAQRKQNLKQLDELLKSVFLEMFGDPVRNEKVWLIENCDKVVLDISSGTSYGGEDRPFVSEEEIGVLKISAVTRGTFDHTEFKVVNPAQVTKPLIFVKTGDFLFSRANTIQLVAACCVVPRDFNQLFLPDKLWVLTLNPELVNKQFFNYLLKNERYRDVVRSLASGGHDSMLNISMKKFLTLNVPCPPIHLQNKFSVIVEKVKSIESRYQQSLDDLEDLYISLNQQAFKGKLDLSRLPIPPKQPHLNNTVSTEIIYPKNEAKTPIYLPDFDKLTDVPYDDKVREELFSFWLSAYIRQIKDKPFSVQDFMIAVQTRLEELHSDNDFELGFIDYESIKAWVFDALADGRLQQALNITEIDKTGEPILGNLIELKAFE